VRKPAVSKIVGLPDFIITSNNPKKLPYPTSSRDGRDGAYTNSIVSLERYCGDYELLKR
jgi:hypothetical protein